MKIKDATPKQLKAVVFTELQKAYKIAGYNAQDNYADTVNLMCENLTRYFGNNDTTDIATAFERGALGEYGEYAGISVKTLYGWMRTFNGNAVNRVAEIEPDAPAVEEQRDKAQDGRNLVNSCYDTFCNKGCYFVPSTILLRILKDNEIVFTDDDLAAAKIQAESNLSTEFMANHQRYMKLKDYIERNIDTSADGVLVNNFFTKCMKQGKKTLF